MFAFFPDQRETLRLFISPNGGIIAKKNYKKLSSVGGHPVHTPTLPWHVTVEFYKGYALITLRYAPIRLSGFARARMHSKRRQVSRIETKACRAARLPRREKFLFTNMHSVIFSHEWLDVRVSSSRYYARDLNQDIFLIFSPFLLVGSSPL